jgi:Secretion system C-terminal sorting domain
MKKFYYGVVIAFLFAFLPSQKNLAQNACPPGTQKVFNAVGINALGQKVYMVYIEGFLPTSNISLFQNVQIFSNGSITDASGNGRIVYNPVTFTPDAVSTCAIPGCCTTPVPPVINCAANVLNIKYPANPAAGIPEICALYLSNSAASAEVRVFDANQVMIPTSSSNFAFTNINGFVCYVYACDKVPTSITACGATGCCSQPIPGQSALPIKLTSFSVILNTDKKAQLNWVSNLEIGGDKFIVERSTNGKNFAPVGEIKSSGNTTSVRRYSYTDASFTSIGYYRLKMVDIDGQFQYSKVVYVNNKGGSGIITQIFPNPFKSDIQLIGISASDLNRKNIRVYSPTGQQVNFNIIGANAISLDENAPSGLYILAVKDQRFKLMKQ